MHVYGLIGKSLKHSFSKDFFQKKFDNEGIDAVYELIELSDIDQIKNIFTSNVYSGLNVTIPFKETIIPYLDELSEEAEVIGAVNVVSFKNGKIVGHNTDAFGFHQSIKPFLTNKHEKGLIIGSGGAAKAVAFVFKGIGIDCLYAVRNPKAENQFPLESINEYMLNACKVIVNCTPVGTFPNVHDTFLFPSEFLTKEHLCVDLIYNPEKTVFLRNAEMQGAEILNGASMLKQQALKAWEIWNQ